MLGDVLRVVADALEALERENGVEDRLQEPRTLHRHGHELAQRGLELLVDLAVQPRDLVRDARASPRSSASTATRIDSEASSAMCRSGWCITRDGPPAPSAGACEREARDLLRLVAGALEVGHRARDREHGPQVARDRGLAGEQPEALGLDLGLPGVDLPLAPQHELRRLAVGVEQRPHGRLDLLRHERAHLVRTRAQLRQRAVVGLDGMTLAGLVHVRPRPPQP